MTVELRLSGEPDDITALLALLQAQGVRVALNPRQYPNRGGFGVRMFAQVRHEPSGSGPVIEADMPRRPTGQDG